VEKLGRRWLRDLSIERRALLVAEGLITSLKGFSGVDFHHMANRIANPDNCGVFINCGVVHWTDEMLESAKQSIEEAVSFWNGESLARHHLGARLDISVNYTNNVFNGGAAFTVEDIGSSEEFEFGSSAGWIDALSLIDANYGQYDSVETATRQFNDDIRRSHQSHWAVTTFIKPYSDRAFGSINGLSPGDSKMMIAKLTPMNWGTFLVLQTNTIRIRQMKDPVTSTPITRMLPFFLAENGIRIASPPS
jgi:hypothetical protein